MAVPGLRIEPRVAEAASNHATPARGLLLAIAAVLLLVNLRGLPYYLLPVDERVRDPLHAWFKPSGHIGQAAGVLTLLLFLFMYLYPLRKRFARLAPWGSLVRWLNLHIVAGLTIPIVGAMHAGWRFNGLIGVGYLAMLVVSISGVVGRYLYVHIPHGRSGLELDLAEIEEQRQLLTARIARAAGLQAEAIESALGSALDLRAGGGVLVTCRNLIAGDLIRWKVGRALRRRWGRTLELDHRALRDALRLARRRIKLEQQHRMLDATRRLFRLWHVVHRPFSITAFVAVVIHVVVVVSLGVTWFW